ncbi:MAG: hypothetical protein ACREB2_00015 [Pseudolabrys sp.]
MNRIVLLVALLAITPVLAGCENFDMDSLDVFGLNKKKKLPGERKELFPGGVPGVSQGIPPEYLKGNQPPPETALAPTGAPGGPTPDDKQAAPGSKTAAIAPAEEPKPKPKRKPKPRAVAHAPTQITVKPKPKNGQSSDQPQQQLAPWPNTPPAQQGQTPAVGQSSSTAPWPTAPAPGTFSR